MSGASKDTRVHVHERHGVGVATRRLEDGRLSITIIDPAGELHGVVATFVVPARVNWIPLLGRAICRIDYFEKVFKRLLREQRGRRDRGSRRARNRQPADPSRAVLRLVK